MKDEGPDDRGGNEKFLERWSRLKQEAKEPARPDPSSPQPPQIADAAPPELPPVETLTPESDYHGFLHPKVNENLRRAALKKLFADPHFNVMDGLDVYIDDYSKSEPLPAALLAQLRQAQKILDWAREKKEDAEGCEPGATGAVVAAGDDKRIVVAEPPAEIPVVATDAPVGQPADPSLPRTSGELPDR